jgi:hypothetical protein
MHLVGAIEKFGGMSRQELQKIAIEIATLGTDGFDVNDSRERYQVPSLPGRFSGLHMVCLKYAAFKIIDPTADIGFDLAKGLRNGRCTRRAIRTSVRLVPTPSAVCSALKAARP